MIIFISAILYTVQLIVQNCNCLYLIDLPQGREANSAKWRLASRAPEMYEPHPRKRGMKPYLRRHMLRNDRPGDKIPSKASRPAHEDEKDATLKNKLKTLMDKTMVEALDRMKEIDEMKAKYTADKAFKTGFVLSMVKKSREVLNELFNVAIKHRDEWQALEQLKIFEMIVNTNVDTNQFLKQLQDIQAGTDTLFPEKPGNPDPAKPDPAKPDPAKPDSTNLDPAKPDSANLDPAKPDPAKPDPAKPDSANLDPANLDPAKPDSANLDPAKPDSANLDPANLDPAKPDSANLDPAKPDSANLDPAKPDSAKL